MSDETKEPEGQAAEATQPDEGGTKLRKVSNGELKGILAAHVKWVESGGKEGECADLHSSYLRKANLQWADLRSADLQGANLADAVLQAANLSGAKLQEANFHSANLHKADLHGTNLRKAVLASANLQEADLRSANLQEADLRGANFFNANLGGADLRGAKVRGAELVKANLREANLRRADLTEANLNGATLEDANLSNATLDGAKLLGAHLYRTNFQNADIKGAKFQGADLKEANLRDANLQNANFEDANSFLSEQLAGTNVSGATLPDDIAEFKGLDHVTEISKHARNIFLAVIGGCVFSWLTIATTTDVALLTNTASTPLPIIQTKVPIAGFYWAAPAILLALYFYLHFYLQSLWEGLASLPAIFPDGRTLDERAYPWLMTSLVREFVPLLTNERRPFTSLKAGISISIAWGLVPFTFVWFWLRYLPRHDWPWTIWHILLIVVAAGFGAVAFQTALATLRGKLRMRQVEATTSIWEHWKRKLRSLPHYRPDPLTAIVMTVAVVLTVAVSVGAIEGTPGGPNRDPRTWTPALFEFFGYRTHADLVEAEVSTRPQDWWKVDEKQEIELKGIRGAKLRKRDLRRAAARGAFLAKADLRETNLQQADLEGANLQKANLQGANLREINLQGAYLFLADLQGADLQGANLQGAYLAGAEGLRQDQLDKACGNAKTRLPPGLSIKPCPKKGN